MMDVPAWILLAYVAIGCAYWLWTLVGTIRTARAVPVLSEQAPEEPESWPTLSVVVPACNEADAIETAAATILAQDYPGLEVILVDDRSTDGTGALIDQIAAGDARSRAVHIKQLPDGWLGKVHALDLGTSQATGDWLLFTDADVHFAPGTFRRAVAWAEHRKLDHLAAVPDIWPSSLVLDAAVAAFLRAFCVAMRCWAIENPRSSACIGVGAFNLVRRAAFERTPGFGWLRLEVADDVGLGMMMKRSGGRSALVNAAGLVGLYWYRTLGEAAAGAEKGYASLGGCSFWIMAAIGLSGAALEWLPIVALAAWSVLPGGPLFGVVMVAAWIASDVVLVRAARRPWRPLVTFLAPVAALVGLAATLRAGWLGALRGGVVWRGTLYPRKQLIAGKRVRLYPHRRRAARP